MPCSCTQNFKLTEHIFVDFSPVCPRMLVTRLKQQSLKNTQKSLRQCVEKHCQKQYRQFQSLLR